MTDLLIVDDDHAILELLEIVFVKAGIRCVILADPSMVEAIVSSEHPSAILMDIYMPPYDGRNICFSLKKHFPSLAVLLCSANVVAHETIAASRADLFIAKPFDIFGLVATVKEYLYKPVAIPADITADLQS